MEKDTILEKLTGIFRDVMDDETITLTEGTTAQDVEEWDSINHIQMIVAVEKQFNIKFMALEIQNLKNIGDLTNTIKQKLQ